jgi:hypothetical protein
MHDSDSNHFRREVAHRGYLPDLRPLFEQSKGSWARPDAGEREEPLLTGAIPTPASEDVGFPTTTEYGTERERKSSRSMWGSVFTLCSATLGAGALSLPYAISKLGLVLGLGLLCATAAASYYSITLLVAAMHATRLHSYEELSVSTAPPRVPVPAPAPERSLAVSVADGLDGSRPPAQVHAFGRPLGVAVETAIICFCFGTCVAYTVAIGDILEPVLAMREVREYACIHVCMYACMHACMCVCMYACC